MWATLSKSSCRCITGLPVTVRALLGNAPARLFRRIKRCAEARLFQPTDAIHMTPATIDADVNAAYCPAVSRLIEEPASRCLHVCAAVSGASCTDRDLACRANLTSCYKPEKLLGLIVRGTRVEFQESLRPSPRNRSATGRAQYWPANQK